MGCNPSKNKKAISERIVEYERQSLSYLGTLEREPATINPENYDHYISVTGFYNLIHAGFCGPYISNPNYLLIVDFRFIEEYLEDHVITAIHHTQVDWYTAVKESLVGYSSIVFYDDDGTSSANVRSFIKRIVKKLSAHHIEAFCLLGGIKSLRDEFSYLITSSNEHISRMSSIDVSQAPPRFQEKRKSECMSVPWMPTLISFPHSCFINNGDKKSRIFLGRLEQADDPQVAKYLGITHMLSIGRSPEIRRNHISYLGLDGETDFYQTIVDASRLLRKLISKNGRILVHGVEGLNRSAAVIIGYLMATGPFLLEEAYFYLQVQRPFLSVDDESLRCLSIWEKSIFGSEVSDLDTLWK